METETEGWLDIGTDDDNQLYQRTHNRTIEELDTLTEAIGLRKRADEVRFGGAIDRSKSLLRKPGTHNVAA